MPPRYFIQRPNVTEMIQWTGDNFAELEAWVTEHASWALPITVELDGTITLIGPDSGMPPLVEGDWMTVGGFASDEQVQGAATTYQEVPGPRLTFDTTNEP
jgi:hypothetical protein